MFLRRFLLLTVSLGISIGPLFAAEPAPDSPLPTTPPSAASAYRKLASELPFISYASIPLDQDAFAPYDWTEVRAASKLFRDGMRQMFSVDELAPLVNDPDPKIRTLAIIGLFETEDRRAVPLIFSRLGDDARTFPDQAPAIGTTFGEKAYPPQPATVHEVALRLLHEVGFSPRQLKPDPEEFAAWRARCLDRPDWLDWYVFRARRATQLTSTPSPERAPKIARLHHDILALSAPLRDWVILSFAGKDAGPFFTEEETLAAARNLGPDALLAFLRDGTCSGLEPLQANAHGSAPPFLLSHGADLFRPTDANHLFALGCYALAAKLKPSLAPLVPPPVDEFNRADRYQNFVQAMSAFAAEQGDAEADFFVAWFYDELCSADDESAFFSAYFARQPAHWQKLLRGLVEHPSFDQIGLAGMRKLAAGINQLADRKVCPDALLNHPEYGDLSRRLRKYFDAPPLVFTSLVAAPASTRQPIFRTGVWADPRSGLCLDPADQQIVLTGFQGKLLLLDAGTGKAVSTLERAGSNPICYYEKSDGRLHSLEWSGSGIAWDLSTGQPISKSKPLAVGYENFPSPSCDLLVSRSSEREGVTIGKLSTGSVLWHFPMQFIPFCPIALSPDGQRLACTTGMSKFITLWDVSQHRQIATLKGHAEIPTSLSFSPDSSLLVSAANDERFFVWDAHTGERRAALQRTTGSNGPVVFMPDSRRLVAASAQGMISIFDVLTGKAQLSFSYLGREGRDHRLLNFVPSADGARLFALHSRRLPESTMSTVVLECWPLSETSETKKPQ